MTPVAERGVCDQCGRTVGKLHAGLCVRCAFSKARDRVADHAPDKTVYVPGDQVGPAIYGRFAPLVAVLEPVFKDYRLRLSTATKGSQRVLEGQFYVGQTEYEIAVAVSAKEQTSIAVFNLWMPFDSSGTKAHYKWTLRLHSQADCKAVVAKAWETFETSP